MTKILIIDDDKIIQRILKGLLDIEGRQIFLADNGNDGFNIVNQEKPDLVLVDAMMEGIDGFEVCRRLKGDPNTRHIPVIMVTALSEKENLAHALESGADDFITKPVNAVELRARARSLLRIKRQYDKIEAAMKMRSDLANMIVHDMRSPLTIILGHSQSLAEETDLSAHARARVHKLVEQARRLFNYIDELMIMAKTEEEILVLHRTDVDIAKLLQDAASVYGDAVDARKIKIVLDLPEKICSVSLDAHLFARIIDNLLSNALKYSFPDTMITLRAQCPASTEHAHLLLQVIDEGPGIPFEDQENIFNKYKIVEMNQQNVSQTGLGLAFCKLVVEAHGGKIWVENNQPTGSIFSLEIPVE